MTALLLAAVLALTPSPTVEIRGMVTAQTAVDAISALALAAPNPVTVEISSGGGDVRASSAIAKALWSYPGTVRCHADVAASGAFWILQACGERSVEPGAFMMEHFPFIKFSQDTVGDSEWRYEAGMLRELADLLDASTDEMLGFIAARSGISLDAIKAMISAAPMHLWTLDSQQAAMLNLTDRTETAAEFRSRP